MALAGGGWDDDHGGKSRTDQRLDPAIGGFILNSTDITDRKEAQAELEHRAFHDPLTGLANRALFIDRACNAIARLARYPGHVGVLLLDLDNFKTINDSLGHVVGDDLLIEVAGRVAGCLRPSDTAARLGGDEFALLVDGLGGQEAVSALAERILEAIAQPMVIGGRTISTTASVGVALTEDPAATPVELIRDSDIAMCQAKRFGRGRVEVFETDMRNAVSRRMLLTTDLADAIERGALSAVYQPIVALEDARIVGMEALARWTHPELGPITPDEFIPLAEEHGLIGALGNWVLHEACREAAGWQDLRPAGGQAVYLTVNLSTRQLEQPTLAGEVVHALEESGLPPQLLTLEITESALMHDVDACARMMSGLKRIGLRVAIDDFGTGYSSLSSLARLPVDIVKIDRSFIAHMHDGGAPARLAGSIVQLSAALGLDTVAEGIECTAQAEALRVLGCGYGQGYLFSRPVPGDEVAAITAGSLDAPIYSLADGVL